MKFKTMMVIKAVVCLVMGAWLMFFYKSIAALLGGSALVNSLSVFHAQEYPGAMFGIMLITWFGRNAVESDLRRGVIWGLVVYDAIGVVISVIATLNGTFNFLGWSIAALYLFLTVGFAYFLVKPPTP